MRTAMQRAIEILQDVAKGLGSVEAPSVQDVETILREVPRFELAASRRNERRKMEVVWRRRGSLRHQKAAW